MLVYNDDPKKRSVRVPYLGRGFPGFVLKPGSRRISDAHWAELKRAHPEIAERLRAVPEPAPSKPKAKPTASDGG